VRCTWPDGCKEVAHFEYDSQHELRAMQSRDYYRQWKCVWHTQPDRNLVPEHQANSVVLVCAALINDDGKEYGRSWREEGASSGSGFSHSPAHKATAADWPVGTRLVVTAYIETPDQAEIARTCDDFTPEGAS